MSILPIKPTTKSAHLKTASTIIIALTLTSSIMIAPGCKKKSDIAGDDVSLAGINVDMSDVLAVVPRAEDSATSEEILSNLGAWDKSDKFTWEEREINGNNYVYENVKVDLGSDETLAADSMALTGLHYQDGAPFADKVVFDNISLSADEAKGSIKKLGFTKADLSGDAWFLPVESIIKNVKPGPFKLGEKNKSEMGNLLLKEVELSIQDDITTNISADHIAFKANETSHKIDMIIDDLDVKLSDTPEGPINMSLKNMVYKDYSLGGLNPKTDSIGSLIQTGSGAIEGLKVTTNFMNIELPKSTQIAKTKGDNITITNNTPSLTIDLTNIENLKSRDAQQMIEMVKLLDYDKMVFSAKSKATANKSSGAYNLEQMTLNLKNGFNINMDGSFDGLQALFKDGATTEDTEAMGKTFKLNNFAFSIEDKSILDRAFKIYAQQAGIKPEAARVQAKAGLGVIGLMGAAQPGGEVLAEISEAASKFVGDGGTLTFKLNPSTPLSAAEIEDIQRSQNLKALGLSVTHK